MSKYIVLHTLENQPVSFISDKIKKIEEVTTFDYSKKISVFAYTKVKGKRLINEDATNAKAFAIGFLFGAIGAAIYSLFIFNKENANKCSKIKKVKGYYLVKETREEIIDKINQKEEL